MLPCVPLPSLLLLFSADAPQLTKALGAAPPGMEQEEVVGLLAHAGAEDAGAGELLDLEWARTRKTRSDLCAGAGAGGGGQWMYVRTVRFSLLICACCEG